MTKSEITLDLVKLVYPNYKNNLIVNDEHDISKSIVDLYNFVYDGIKYEEYGTQKPSAL
jgi:hypothetical protein